MRIAVSLFAMFCIVTAVPAAAQGTTAQTAPRPATQPAPAAAQPAAAPRPAAQPNPAPQARPAAIESPAKFIDRHDEWHSYAYEAGGSKVCFLAAVPKDTEPKNVRRGPVYFYLTTWQKEGIRHEASVSIGYPLKEDGPPVIVEIGGQTFEFFGRKDKAFIKNPEEERKLVEAMKTGSVMNIKGVSWRGTQTSDQYSLAGVAAAVKKVEELCP